ncbi:MAG: DEAD/DEAH box helicase family protein, partial [Coriobacteriales bacterium]
MTNPLAVRMQTDPVWSAEHVFGAHLWSKQREIIESVWKNQRTGVKSCHGSGKTFLAAIAVLTFLHAFPDSIVITTAPTWEQVRRLLWKEVNRIHARTLRSGIALGSVCHTADCEVDDAWFALGLSTNDPNRFVGHHAPYILVVIDEAFGVEDWVFEVAETYMTASGNEGTMARLLAIGNPTDPGSTLGRAFHTARAGWSLHSISVFDTPNLTGEDVPQEVARMLPGREWVEDKRTQWGEDSAMWHVRVLGEFSAVS